jgi:sarcosine oxidase subunit alpha
VTFGVLAGENVGELFEPTRKTAIHEWHEAAGAPMEVVGQWDRPWYFPQDDEDLHAAVARECLATRGSLGIMDASTLGKIDVRGADTVEFLERIYTHNVGKMNIGQCAYGVMLGEDGMLMDDGVMARLDKQHYYLTTTTGGAANVLSCPENLPFMRVVNTTIAGLPVQIFRVSFSGELAFELNISSNLALHLWRLLMGAGDEYGITPYGTETMHVLRAEKGFLIIGQDTDGSVTPEDAGLGWLLSKGKDFMGKRSLSRPDCERTDRKQLVGLLSEDGKTLLAEGSQLVVDANAPVPVPMCGHVTSAYMSACLGHPIALAVVEGGRARIGETLAAVSADGSETAVKIVSPVFYDPKGERQND